MNTDDSGAVGDYRLMLFRRYRTFFLEGFDKHLASGKSPHEFDPAAYAVAIRRIEDHVRKLVDADLRIES